MYVLPKGLESAWTSARGKGLVFRTGKHGSALVSFAVLWAVRAFGKNIDTYVPAVS
jgi:hypothetical protein